MEAAPKLLHRVRDRIRAKHYSFRTEQTDRRFILFNDKKHPAEMSAPEVEGFLTHLTIEGRVAASTQNQALALTHAAARRSPLIRRCPCSSVTSFASPSVKPKQEINRSASSPRAAPVIACSYE
jgi:hypothetical protein